VFEGNCLVIEICRIETPALRPDRQARSSNVKASLGFFIHIIKVNINFFFPDIQKKTKLRGFQNAAKGMQSRGPADLAALPKAFSSGKPYSRAKY
jgi:hypothetical protein